MRCLRYVPEYLCYNAFDLSLSEFDVRRVIAGKRQTNIALASATDIPLPAASASLIVSTECLEHIPDVKDALREIRRVASDGGHLICSIANNHCHKYRMKGEHPEHVNNWHYAEFIEEMTWHGYQLVEGFMKGYWIPLPAWLTKTSYQLPLSHAQEYYNTNFIYVFRAV